MENVLLWTFAFTLNSVEMVWEKNVPEQLREMGLEKMGHFMQSWTIATTFAENISGKALGLSKMVLTSGWSPNALSPKERAPISVEILTDSEDWQLQKLENGFRAEVGVPALTEEMYSKLTAAIQNGETTFFLAKRGYRLLGCAV